MRNDERDARLPGGIRALLLRASFVIRHSSFVIFLSLAASAFAAKPEDPAKDAKHRAAQTEFLHGPIVSIAFEVKDDDMEALRKNPRHYVEGVMKVGDKTWKGVALKLKGAEGRALYRLTRRASRGWRKAGRRSRRATRSWSAWRRRICAWWRMASVRRRGAAR